MDRRRALATVVSLTIGATGIAAAVGATTRVFNVAEASPGVGRVSPVDAPTSPPVVDPPVVETDDVTATDAPVATAMPVVTSSTSRPSPPTTASAVPQTSTPTEPAPHHESEARGEDD